MCCKIKRCCNKKKNFRRQTSPMKGQRLFDRMLSKLRRLRVKIFKGGRAMLKGWRNL